MDKFRKNKGQKVIRQPNPLEALKDVARGTADQMQKEAAKLPSDFMEQLLGIRPQPRNFSGELVPGEVIEINEVYSGRYEEIQRVKKKTALEKRLLEEEHTRTEKKTNKLRMYLTAIRQELLVLAQKTENLAEQTEAAAMQAPVEPGLYHVIFFEKLLEFIKSFTHKIEEAAVWLQAVNKRAARKNAWGANYKKYGAKYLLSGEHYLQRSAG